jgi:hypothetical protein
MKKLVAESLNEFNGNIPIKQLFPPGMKSKPSKKEIQAKSEARDQLNQLINDNDGWIYLAMVHHFYGPMKGSVKLIRAGDVGTNEVLDFIDETNDPISASPEVQSFLYQIFTDLQLMPTCQILPKEHLPDSDQEYDQVNSIDQYMNEVLDVISKNKGDPYYHRKGNF